MLFSKKLNAVFYKNRSSPPEAFVGKGVLKICNKFLEHPCWNVISIILLFKFIKHALRHGCSSLNLLHIFRTSFYKAGRLLLEKTFMIVVWQGFKYTSGHLHITEISLFLYGIQRRIQNPVEHLRWSSFTKIGNG